ncbi:pancreatic triacylglycerol lipase-like [Leguminivora glycinivorella]|uniref:pancreatic triacylglycerol lipase-like n=1 Tax=Leguminivora glycinivorella TaxID=1035111 RepID=UPI00200DC762|nr:pancreatic triacylglycerol lipase-like [Leguminivora glycinivorella]XP_047995916.1 pancreatic triacylglycerol lipase-like [Leguminivora glycinivorella]XP_047995917.1 pancreatic triacylglycerol lipase-like [Leguminivora glycinivorella]
MAKDICWTKKDPARGSQPFSLSRRPISLTSFLASAHHGPAVSTAIGTKSYTGPGSVVASVALPKNLRMRSAIVLLTFAAFAASVPVPEDQADFDYPRYIQFPDGNGVPHTVDFQEEVDHNLLEEIQRNPANNLYLLYTRRNPTNSQRLIINDKNSILNSNFNPNHPTVVIAHGWLSNQNTDLNPVIRNAFHRKGEANVIVLDWRRLATSGYVTAVNGIPAVGWGLGQFLRFVHEVTGARYSSMHLVGFSLGAHLVGNAGRALGGAVARITGLDPAGPLWNTNRNRLSPNDGVYVEAIHTDGGYTVGGLGIGIAIANADFFPNGGISQPRCLTNICNHNRAWELFAVTVSYNHLIGQQCSSNLQITLNNCRGSALHMGNDDLRKWGTGKYRLDTGRSYPF